MADSENRQTAVNDPRTRAVSDTNVTHTCSGFEPTPESVGAMAALAAKANTQGVTHFFDDPIDIRRALIARRERNGADTPDGHTCSNIVEGLENLFGYIRPGWATDVRQTLPWMINQQIERLERHRAQGE